MTSTADCPSPEGPTVHVSSWGGWQEHTVTHWTSLCFKHCTLQLSDWKKQQNKPESSDMQLRSPAPAFRTFTAVQFASHPHSFRVRLTKKAELTRTLLFLFLTSLCTRVLFIFTSVSCFHLVSFEPRPKVVICLHVIDNKASWILNPAQPKRKLKKQHCKPLLQAVFF